MYLEVSHMWICELWQIENKQKIYLFLWGRTHKWIHALTQVVLPVLLLKPKVMFANLLSNMHLVLFVRLVSLFSNRLLLLKVSRTQLSTCLCMMSWHHRTRLGLFDFGKNHNHIYLILRTWNVQHYYSLTGKIMLASLLFLIRLLVSKHLN